MVEGAVRARGYASLGLFLLVIVALAAACAPPQPSGVSSSSSAERPSAPKRVIAAIRGNPISVSHRLTAGGGGRIDGARELNGLVSSGLSVNDASGQSMPALAESVPSI